MKDEGEEVKEKEGGKEGESGTRVHYRPSPRRRERQLIAPCPRPAARQAGGEGGQGVGFGLEAGFRNMGTGAPYQDPTLSRFR